MCGPGLNERCQTLSAETHVLLRGRRAFERVNGGSGGETTCLTPAVVTSRRSSSNVSARSPKAKEHPECGRWVGVLESGLRCDTVADLWRSGCCRASTCLRWLGSAGLSGSAARLAASALPSFDGWACVTSSSVFACAERPRSAACRVPTRLETAPYKSTRPNTAGWSGGKWRIE